MFEMIVTGDLFTEIPKIADNSIDAGVTDPPYGLGFMGKKWDTFTPGAEDARTAANVDIASDNPNVRGRQRSPAASPSAVEYDRSLEGQRRFQEWTEAWAREMFRVIKPGGYLLVCGAPRSYHRMATGVEDAGFEIRDTLAWLFGQGFPKSLNLLGGLGTALKPAYEPIVMARKPFKGTIAKNLAAYGTGALNIDACRLYPQDEGRWPPNVAIDDLAAIVLDEPDANGKEHERAKFFYCAKPSRAERDFGCELLLRKTAGECTDRQEGSAGLNNPRAGAGRTGGGKNFHPTVKPVALMKWLVRMVTPVGGTVLDPFMGSGTTGMACRYEQRNFYGIEREPEFVDIARARIAAVNPLLAEGADDIDLADLWRRQLQFDPAGLVGDPDPVVPDASPRVVGTIDKPVDTSESA